VFVELPELGDQVTKEGLSVSYICSMSACNCNRRAY